MLGLHLRRAATAATVPAILAAVLALSAAGTAQAATVNVAGRCFAFLPKDTSQPMPISVTGLAPNAATTVALRVRGVTVSGLPSVAADPLGSLVTRLEHWNPALGGRPSKGVAASIVVSNSQRGDELASTPLQVTTAAVQVEAAAMRATTKRSWRVSGLSLLGGGQTYYAHYFRGRSHVGSQRLGGATGPCGYLLTRAVLAPFKVRGKTEVVVQASRHYDPTLLALPVGTIYRAGA